MEERQRGPAEAPNLGEPAEPRPAASVVLLRRGGKHAERALEVLLLKRTESAKFMPGVWVFPGGAVDPEDGEGEAGYRACAVRELAEEAAIELPADEELVLFSRWITPEVVSTALRRLVLPRPRPRPHAAQAGRGRDDRGRPGSSRSAALEAQAAGELALAFPTIKPARVAARPSATPTRQSTPTATARSSRSCPR